MPWVAKRHNIALGGKVYALEEIIPDAENLKGFPVHKASGRIKFVEEVVQEQAVVAPPTVSTEPTTPPIKPVTKSTSKAKITTK